MYCIVKTISHIKYYYNERKDRWEGIKSNASTFSYSELVKTMANRFTGEEYSKEKA